MATTQAKQLRKIINAFGLKRHGDNPQVRTERKYIGRWEGRRQYEYGYAVAHVDALTDQQIEDLKSADPYLKIYNNREFNFAILKG